MSNATEAPFDFAKLAKKYKPKSAQVLAVKHKGPAVMVANEDRHEVAHEGDYIVQVGEREATEIVPPSTKPNGERVPGSQRAVKVPVLNVMSAEDFESAYEA